MNEDDGPVGEACGATVFPNPPIGEVGEDYLVGGAKKPRREGAGALCDGGFHSLFQRYGCRDMTPGRIFPKKIPTLPNSQPLFPKIRMPTTQEKCGTGIILNVPP